MEVYRIKAQHIMNGALVPKQEFELIAGLTAEHSIEKGVWYGVVFNAADYNPFMLSKDGYCQYAGDRTQRRQCTIVAKSVVPGEMFELAWADEQDRYVYKILTVSRLTA